MIVHFSVSSIGKVERPNSLSGEYSGFSTSEECGEHRVTKTLVSFTFSLDSFPHCD